MLWKCQKCGSKKIGVKKLMVQYLGNKEKSRGIVRCMECGNTYAFRRSVHAVDLISGANGAPAAGTATAAGE